MKILRHLTVLPVALLLALAFSAGSAFADARDDCTGVDTEASSANLTEARRAIICLANRERVARGMSALNEERHLTASAQSHSEDMANHNYFSHEDRSGGQPWDRAEKAGYATGYVGENISAGYATPLAAITGWMKSSGHCANILKASYVDIGIGIATKSSSDYGIYWTMVLGGNDSSAPKVKVRCPYSKLVSGTVPGVNEFATGKSAVKAKVTSIKRKKNGHYRIKGMITPAAKGTVVKLTVKRGKKTRKYTVKTSESGKFSKTVRAPKGSGKVRVSAKA